MSIIPAGATLGRHTVPQRRHRTSRRLNSGRAGRPAPRDALTAQSSTGKRCTRAGWKSKPIREQVSWIRSSDGAATNGSLPRRFTSSRVSALNRSVRSRGACRSRRWRGGVLQRRSHAAPRRATPGLRPQVPGPCLPRRPSASLPARSTGTSAAPCPCSSGSNLVGLAVSALSPRHCILTTQENLYLTHLLHNRIVQ
jgi:hypothetical protein